MKGYHISKPNISALLIFLFYSAVCFAGDGSGLYWVSPDGAANWANCESSSPMSGTACCSLGTANTNAGAGNVVNLRAGTYGQTIQPSKSGTSGSPIIYQAHSGETVVISGHNQWNTFMGIFIDGKSYIRISGITIRDVDRWLLIRNGAQNNEISHCSFEPPVKIGIYIWNGSSAPGMAPATHTWFHHNTVRDLGYVSNCNDEGALVYIGVPSYDSESGNNTIENNTFYHGGHHILETYTKYNVIRGNVMHNEGFMENPGGCPYAPDSSGKYGNRNIQVYDGYSREGTYNLIEGNRFGHAGQPPDDDGGSNMELTAPKNIVRYNFFFNGTNNGIYFKAGTGSYSNNNRVYNNTLCHNGYNGTSGAQSRTGMRFRNDIYKNVIKNNIIYDNDHGDFSCAGTGCTLSQQQITNNWLQVNGNPEFINVNLSDKFSLTLPDLSLQASSKAIDGGTFLTQTTAAGNNSTTLVVEDALYFQDGSWGASIAMIQPDTIAIGSVDKTVKIKQIDYSTNTITLESPMNWNEKAPVWLYKDSSGTRVLYGTAPDYGAAEFESPSGVLPPKNLRLSGN